MKARRRRPRASALGSWHTNTELIARATSSADVNPRKLDRHPQRLALLTLAALLAAAGCARSQRSSSNSADSDPQDPQDSQAEPRGKLLDTKLFCRLGGLANGLTDDFPVDLALDRPTGPDAQVDALSIRVEGVQASAKGQVVAGWKLDRECVVERSELMFEGQARGQARLVLEVESDVTIEDLTWTSGWTNVAIPVGPIPLFVSVKLGVDVDAEIRAQQPVRLIVEGRGEVGGKFGVTQTGVEVELDPPETFDLELEPRIEASADFAMDLHPVPWIDVRLYGVAGGRLSVASDIAIVCTALADPSARRCTADYRVAPTIQPLIGAADVVAWEGPVIPLPLPANLRAGSVELPVSGRT